MARTTIEVPDEWAVAAEESDVPLAEYCRRMVRAGRRQFGNEGGDTDETETAERITDRSPAERLVAQKLDSDTGRDVDDLLNALEADVTEAADALVEAGEAKYRHARGGWIETTDE